MHQIGIQIFPLGICFLCKQKNGAFLKIVRTPNRKRNKHKLYGPYPNVKAARTTVEMINRIYPLRKCEKLKKDLFLYYHIGECLGYCKKEINIE